MSKEDSTHVTLLLLVALRLGPETVDEAPTIVAATRTEAMVVKAVATTLLLLEARLHGNSKLLPIQLSQVPPHMVVILRQVTADMVLSKAWVLLPGLVAPLVPLLVPLLDSAVLDLVHFYNNSLAVPLHLLHLAVLLHHHRVALHRPLLQVTSHLLRLQETRNYPALVLT